jgi:hypothetical protein
MDGVESVSTFQKVAVCEWRYQKNARTWVAVGGSFQCCCTVMHRYNIQKDLDSP